VRRACTWSNARSKLSCFTPEFDKVTWPAKRGPQVTSLKPEAGRPDGTYPHGNLEAEGKTDQTKSNLKQAGEDIKNDFKS
jgi:hypothetical protein